MLVGHYAPAFIIKSLQPKLPLWLLLIAVQLVDIAWTLFIFIGVEKVRIIPYFTASNPLDLYYMPYTHSLFAALLWALGSLLAYRFIPHIKPWILAIWLGVAVLSHWLLDLLVHTPDLPLIGDSHKVGLGLWNHPYIALALELGLICLSALFLSNRLFQNNHASKVRVLVLCIVLSVTQIYSLFGPIPTTPQALSMTMLSLYLICAGLAWKLK